MLNFIKIGRSVAEIWRFFYIFHDGGRRPWSIFKIAILNVRRRRRCRRRRRNIIISIINYFVEICLRSHPGCESIWNTDVADLHHDLIEGALSTDQLKSFCRF